MLKRIQFRRRGERKPALTDELQKMDKTEK